MGRLHWNFADRSRWHRPWLAVGVIALGGCIHALWWRDTLLTQRQDMVERAGRLARRAAMQQRPVAPAVPAVLEAVFAEMRYPWMDMLDSLRAATPAGVDLLTLEPDSGAIRRVHIRGVADQTQSVLALVTALHQDPAWSSVQLVSQARSGDAGPPPSQHSMLPLSDGPGSSGALPPSLSFSLRAEWRGL